VKAGEVEHMSLARHTTSDFKLRRETFLDWLWSLPSLKPLTGGAISGFDVGQDG